MPIVNGTTYHVDTDPRVITILERFMHNRTTRLRLVYGDVATGVPWAEAPDYYGACDTGYISRSMGPQKIPICVANRRALGGGSLLTHCILKIEYANRKHGGVLYNPHQL